MNRIMLVGAAAAAAMAVAGWGCNRNRDTSSPRGEARSSGAATTERDTGRTYATTQDTGAMGGEASLATSFLKEAAMSGHAEIELSNIALRQATRPEVRDFAQRMVDDHTAANNRAMELARARNIALPSQPDTMHRQAADRLLSMRGEEFDREYMRLMVSDHEQAVRRFEAAARDVRDPEVNRFVTRTLPILRDHLEMARNIEAGRGAGMQMDPNRTRRMLEETSPGRSPTQPGNTQPGNMQPDPTRPGNNQPGTRPPNSDPQNPGTPR